MGVVGAAGGAILGASVGRVLADRAPRALPGLTVAAAAAGAVAIGRKHAEAQAGSYAEWGGSDGRPGLGAAAGAAAAAGLAGAAVLGATGIASAGSLLSERLPGSATLWTAVATGAGATGLVVGGRAALSHVLAGLARSGAAPDAALVKAPDDAYVTGGPGTLVPYDTLSREGRRFVNWRVTAAEIAAAGADEAKEPIRVFIGVESAGSITERVDLAIAELDRLGAWSRKYLLAVSPAGTGYANSVPVEALEFLSDGDCASVAVQYGLLPSMFSLNKVDVAAATFRQLVDRISERIAERPDGPQLLLYGESLGAEAAQHGLLLKPELVSTETAEMAEADGALFVGTPGGRSLRNDVLHNPATVHVDRWQALPDPLPRGIQMWFLEHDADPVTRFNRTLLWRKPSWLGKLPRGRNVPDDMAWIPITTWEQVLLDVAYATQAQSGVFRSVGHDYRADLAPLVAAAFVPERIDRVPHIQELLSQREITRDSLLSGSEEDHATP